MPRAQCPKRRVQRPASNVQRWESRFQRLKSSVQSLPFRVHRPEPGAYDPESRVQNPASNACIQVPGILVCLHFVMFYFWRYKHYGKQLSNDLWKVNEWPFQWKTGLTLVLVNRLRKSYRVKKMNKWSHPFLVFNNDNVSNANLQKHLGVVFDTSDKRLSFEERLKMIINQLNQTMGVLLKLHKALRRSHQLTLHKVFVRSVYEYMMHVLQ